MASYETHGPRLSYFALILGGKVEYPEKTLKAQERSHEMPHTMLCFSGERRDTLTACATVLPK